MRLVLFLAVAALISGCAGLRLAEEIEDLPPAVNLQSVPFHPQTEYHCGPAALATVLEYSGLAVNIDGLSGRVYTPGLKGSLQAEMTATARSKGRLVYRLPGQPHAVLAEVAAGRPVLVLENLGLESRPVWHYAVVVGYDRNRNTLLLRSGLERELRVAAGRWLRRWDRAGRWAVVTLAPGEFPQDPERDRWISAAADFDAAASPDQAEVVWRQTLDRWPDSAIAWLGLGNSAFSTGDDETAIDAYRQLLALAPGHGPGTFNLAVALARSGQPCDAAEHFSSLSGHRQLAEAALERQRKAAAACSLR